MNLVAGAIAVGLLSAMPVAAQGSANPAPLKFEVASLKPSRDNSGGPRGIRPAPGGERYVATGVPLRLMLMVAYRLKSEQVVGAPGWFDTDLFDMNAKAERPSTGDELHTMLQNLLTERFKLQLHRDTKELPVYVLSVDKGGPKVQPHEAQSAGDPWIDQAIDRVVRVKLKATSAPMEYFAWRLGQMLDRPVVDRTGLKGGYDFELNYTRDLPQGIREGALLNGEPIDTSGPNIFAALRQQLGLKLEPQRAPAEILVIDRAEKLAEN